MAARHSLQRVLHKAADDVVILSALRTPITRAYKGGFREAYDHELLYHALRATLRSHPNLAPAAIHDIQTGTVLSELGGSKAGRMAALAAGYPNTTAFSTVNRACASSLASLINISALLRTGNMQFGIAAGMESMTRNYGSRAIPTQMWNWLKDEAPKEARDCLMSMGLTAENVARRYGVDRKAQDQWAARSQARAAAAQEAGKFDQEIVPVEVEVTDPPPAKPGDASEGERHRVTVSRDDGIRKTSEEKLASLPPAFDPKNGTATAGNSSQISDGAGAVLLARRDAAEAAGLSSMILGRVASSSTIGCAADEMGIGPLLAIPAVLSNAGGLDAKDVGRWEINEAFAAQVVCCVRELGLDEDRVNVNGGAIALGHPLGATGARLVSTMVHELKRSGEEVGCVSACVGTGMGVAVLLVAE